MTATGRPATDTDTELAARYFDEQMAPADRASGMPESLTAKGRERYIVDVCANPEAVEQLREMYAEEEV